MAQCIEKSVKALVIASGKFNTSYIRNNFRHHNSKELLTKLWVEPETNQSSSTLSAICNISNPAEKDLFEALQYTIKLQDLTLFSNLGQFKFEQGDTLTLSVEINGRVFDYLYTYDESTPSLILAERPIETAEKESIIDLAAQLLYESGMKSLVARGISGKKRIKASLEGQFSKERLRLSLFLLAAITWKHEACSRYPRDVDKKIGCQDYNESLAIVKQIDLLYKTLETILPKINELLKPNQ